VAHAAGRREQCDRRDEGVAGVLGDLLAGGDDVLVACVEPRRWRRGLDATLAGLARGRAALASWDLLAIRPVLAEPFPHVFALEPAPIGDPAALPGDGFVHLGWGPAEEAVARAATAARRDVRGTVTQVYRALRAEAPSPLAELEAVLDAIAPRADCALALRILTELSLVRIDGQVVHVPDARPTKLEHSEAYRTRTAA
jgi:hypothetical protein